MARNGRWVEAGVLAGMLALAGCATPEAPTPRSPMPVAIITAIDPKAQPWSELRACVRTGPGTKSVCVTARAFLPDSVDRSPTKLAEVEIMLPAGGPKASWSGDVVGKIDDPVLHLLRIMPSWDTDVAPGPSDFVDVQLPFGFIRNRTPCHDDGDTPLTLDELSDIASFTVYLDGRRDIQIEPAECLAASAS